MARIVSIFQFTGRAGSAVGSKGKGGKILLRQYQPTVNNPRTTAQMSQRAKLKLASQVAAMLGEVGRTSLLANGFRRTDRGQLVRRLLGSIVASADGLSATLQYDLHLVDNPSYAESIALQVTSEATQFVATFSGATDGEAIAKCILVHDLNTGLWRHASSLDTRTAIAIGKSANESGDALEVFAYGIVLEPKTSDALGNIGHTGANQAGYIIDLSKVTATNYAFSPTVSAALTVGTNGATSGGTGDSGSGSDSGSGDRPTRPDSDSGKGEMPTPPDMEGFDGEMPTPPDMGGTDGEMPTPPDMGEMAGTGNPTEMAEAENADAASAEETTQELGSNSLLSIAIAALVLAAAILFAWKYRKNN